MPRKRRQSKSKPALLVDIVIPNLGRFDLLEKCLDAIPYGMEDVPFRVSVFDNGSPVEEKGDFYKMYRQKATYPFRVFENNTNLGYPKAVNSLVRRASAPLIYVLTNDVIIEPGSGDVMVRELDNAEMGVVGMKLLFPEGTERGPSGKVQHVGLAWNIKGNIFHLFLGWSPDNSKVMAVRDVSAVTGAAFMTRRKLWLQSGGFDESYGLGTWEDVDYCMKIKKLGYNIIVSQDALGYHWTNASAVTYGISFPMNENRHLFLSKFGEDIIYDEWRFW